MLFGVKIDEIWEPDLYLSHSAYLCDFAPVVAPVTHTNNGSLSNKRICSFGMDLYLTFLKLPWQYPLARFSYLAY